jgi:NAD(P)-binding Rossmann-like domain
MSSVVREYIIVGGGPAGLTTAWLLAKCGAKCTIIESANSIGGCHRVNRRDGKFSEHGPRVYTSAYKTFEAMLGEMGVDKDSIFTPYKFKLGTIGGKTVANMSAWEIFQLARAYIASMLGIDYTKVSMREFTVGFSPESIDYIDRLCRLTDGASINTYSVHKFLQLINQQGTIYQPRDPNDQLLFSIWQKKLEELGVKILLGTKVDSLIISSGRVLGVRTVPADAVHTPSTPNQSGPGQSGPNQSGPGQSVLTPSVPVPTEVLSQNVILAIPPKPMLALIAKSNNHICGKNIADFTAWVNDNSYSDFISVCFEWNRRLPLDSTWGFPETEWGIAHIVLSDYFRTYAEKTLISTGITKIDTKSSAIGKTARESSHSEIREEVFRQLRLSYPELPPPDSVTIGSDIGDETAYIQSSDDGSFIPHETGVAGLYNVGTQNGKAQFSFTSLETAVVNAHSLAHLLDPKTQQWPIINAWTLNQILLIVLVVVLSIIIIVAVVLQKNDSASIIN